MMHSTDFSKGKVWQNIVAQSIPLILAQLVQLLYNVVDRIYIGHLPGADSMALTGIGLVFPLTTLIAAFTFLFGTGGTPLFSIARGAEFVRDVKPGEIVIVDKKGMRSIETHCGGKSSLCVFEFVYFARPDSVVDGASVHNARLRAGAFLALEHPVQADVIIGVPDSGLDAALGFARQSGIPYGVGFIKNRYIGRTFIQPTQGQRENAVKLKLNAVRATVQGKRVVMIDDSIVRGTTMKRIVSLLREAGATEVHIRISSPPFTNPCYFGTDIDSKDKLIACRMSIDEIRQELGADSLGYLSINSVKQIAENCSLNFCSACFDGEYPAEIPQETHKDKFESRISESEDRAPLS